MRLVGRHGGVALVLALGFAVGPHALLRPASGEAEEPAQRLGDDVCLQCHAQYAPAWQSLRHNQYLKSESIPLEHRGCEGCHGPGSKHLEDPNFRSIRNTKNLTGLPAVAPCLDCHGTQIKAPLWLNTAHARAGLSCGGCHETHQDPVGKANLKKPKNELCLSCHPETSAEFRLNSHHPLVEGRIDCDDCHDVHQAGAGSGTLLKNGDDVCLKCHLEKRGPFVFEHLTTTGAGDDGCLICHRPHGSPNPKLQEFFGRAVCLQCHADIAADAAHLPRAGNCWTVGCHTTVHGSNTNRLLIN